MRKLLALVAAGLLVSSAGAARAFAAPRDVSPTAEASSNWAGYAALTSDPAAPIAFRDVTATWVIPAAHCKVGRSDAAAFWVGVGGFTPASASLEQLGTETTCDGNVHPARYAAWWEIVPAPSVPIRLTVRAGDRVTAALVVDGQTITMSLRDATRKTRFSKVVTVAQTLDVSSAEWIAEAPSTCRGTRCRVLPLTSFGSVTFTKAAAIGNEAPGTISTAPWTATPIQLVPDGNARGFFGGAAPATSLGAVPGGVSADGRSFSITAQPAGPAAGTVRPQGGPGLG